MKKAVYESVFLCKKNKISAFIGVNDIQTYLNGL